MPLSRAPSRGSRRALPVSNGSRLRRAFDPSPLRRFAARINVRALLILVSVGFGLVVGAAVVYKVRKRVMAQQALDAGRQALDRKDWKTACDELRFYLSKYPDDQEHLELYGRTALLVRPLESRYVMAALGAYRRLLRHRPGDDETCEVLCRLNAFTGDYVAVEHVAEKRLVARPDDPDANLWFARALIGQGRRGEATAKLSAFVQAQPTNVEGYLLLSDLTLVGEMGAARPSTEQWTQAREWLDLCLETNPRSAAAHVHRARLRRLRLASETEGIADDDRATREAAALEDLDAAAALQPESPDLLLLLAEEWIAWRKLDRAATAIEAMRDVSDQAVAKLYVDPGEFRLNYYLASSRLATASGEGNRCSDLAGQGLADLVGRQRLAFMPIAVELFLASGDLEGAKNTVEELHRLISEDISAPAETRFQAEIAAAAVDHALGNHFAAIQRMRELVAQKADSVTAWRLLWKALEATEQHRLARNALERYVALASEDAEAHLAMARTLAKDRSPNWRSIFSHADAVERIRPGLAEVRVLRIGGRLLGNAGPLDPAAFDEISAELAAMRRENPRDAMVLLLESSLALLRERPGDAIPPLEQAIRESDNPLGAAVQLARIHLGNGRPDQAISACEAAVQRCPDDADAWIVLSEHLIEVNRPKEARSKLEDAVKSLKGTDRLQAELALIRELIRLGDRDRAIARLDALAVEHPRNVVVRELLLEQPEIRSARARAEELIRQIRGVETEAGLRWRAELARLLVAGDDWHKHDSQIAELAQSCLDADPGHGLAAVALGKLHEKSGRWYEAERVYRDAISANPATSRAAGELLRLLEDQGRFAEAETILEHVHDNAGALRTHHAIIAYARGHLDAARRELESLVRRDPEDLALRVLLARVVRDSEGDADAALKVLDEARPAPAERSPISKLRANLLVSAGRAEEALAFLDDEVRRFDDSTAYLIRAAYFADTGEFDRAEQDYKRVQQFPESKVLGHQLLGAFYAARGRLDDALTEWEAGVALDPRHLGLRISLTRGLLSSKDPKRRDRGREELEKLLTEHPRDTMVRLAKAEQLFADDEPQAAADLLDRLVRDDPASVPAHLQLVNIKRAMGDLQAAYDAIVRAVGRNPDNPALLLEKAAIELKLGRHGLAKATAAEALERWRIDATTRTRAHELVGFAELYLLRDRGDKDGIAALLPDWRAQHPDITSVLKAGAEMLLTGEQPKHLGVVEEIVRHLLAADPESIAAHKLCGRLEFARKNFEACEQAYRRVLELSPDDLPALNDLAWLLSEGRKDPAAALALVNRGLAVRPDDVHLLDTRGVAYFRLGRFDQGRADFERCLGLVSHREDPAALRTRAQVLFHLGRLLSAMNQPDPARGRLLEAREIDQIRNVEVFSEQERAEIRELLAGLPPKTQ